jgi:hypothetical protein
MAKKPTNPLGDFEIVTDPPKPLTRSQQQDLSPVARFLQSIDTQLAAFEADEKGEVLRVQRGSRTTKVRPWWYEVDGDYFLQVRYGMQPLDLDGAGHSTIRVGERARIPTVLAGLRHAVEGGALHDQIEQSAAKQSRARKGGRKSEAAEESQPDGDDGQLGDGNLGDE